MGTGAIPRRDSEPREVGVGFEKYFLRKVRQGKAETFYENLVLDVLGIRKLKELRTEPAD